MLKRYAEFYYRFSKGELIGPAFGSHTPIFLVLFSAPIYALDTLAGLQLPVWLIVSLGGVCAIVHHYLIMRVWKSYNAESK
jgi:hypothetical protein